MPREYPSTPDVARPLERGEYVLIGADGQLIGRGRLTPNEPRASIAWSLGPGERLFGRIQ